MISQKFVEKDNILHVVEIPYNYPKYIETVDFLKKVGYQNRGNGTYYKAYRLETEKEREFLIKVLQNLNSPQSLIERASAFSLNPPIIKIKYNHLSHKAGAKIEKCYDKHVFEDALALLKEYGFSYERENTTWHSAITHAFLNELKEKLNKIGMVVKVSDIHIKPEEVFDADKYRMLLPFQKSLVARAIYNKYDGFFWDTGTGKTISSLIYIMEMGFPAIVLARESLHGHWINEINKWKLPLTYQRINDSATKRLAKWSNLKDVNLVTYETFRIDVQKKNFPFQEVTLVCDEASKLKNSKTKIHKVVKAFRLSKYCKGFLPLTGTPYENSLIDVYNILKIINPNFMPYHIFKDKYLIFKDIYLYRQNRTIKVVSGYKNVNDFGERIKPYASRVIKEEVASYLPEKTFTYEFIDHTDEEGEYFKDLINNARDNGHPFLSVFAFLRMIDDSLQLLNISFQENPSTILPTLISLPVSLNNYIPPKIEVLESVLEELGKKQVVIFTQFARMAKIIYNHFSKKYSCLLLTGGSDYSLINDFKQGKYQILICTDVLAYGIDLPDVDYLINYDIHPNPAITFKQRIDRIHRLTSKNPKTIINLIGGGVEKDIYEILREKLEYAELTLKGIQASQVEIVRELEKKYGW